MFFLVESEQLNPELGACIPVVHVWPHYTVAEDAVFGWGANRSILGSQDTRNSHWQGRSHGLQIPAVLHQSHVILPVIHAESSTQAVRNARVAQEAECDGVFLINHHGTYGQLMEAHDALKSALPDL